jgi:hypothetical protein
MGDTAGLVRGDGDYDIANFTLYCFFLSLGTVVSPNKSYYSSSLSNERSGDGYTD